MQRIQLKGERFNDSNGAEEAKTGEGVIGSIMTRDANASHV